MNLIYLFTLTSLLILVSPSRSTAEELDQASQNALRETQNLLKDPVKREAALSHDEATKTAVSNLSQTVGEQNVNGAYNLSADIFATIVKDSNGDPAKMNEILERAQRDPSSFLKSLSPEQQAKIKEMAERPE